MPRRLCVGLCVLVGVAGCLSSDDDLKQVNWRCENSEQCGPGWECYHAQRHCIEAYENRNGVFEDRLVIGMTAPIDEAPLVPGAELIGRSVRDGFKAYFAHRNRTGGVHGRRLELKLVDDSYLPAETTKAVEQLIVGEDRQAFALVSVLGTEPSLAAKELTLANKVLFFAPASGAEAFEPPSPDRYVFNFRPRYSEEIEQLIEFMNKSVDSRVPRVGCGNIAIFTTSIDETGTPDSIGKGAVDGGSRALRQLCSIRSEDVVVATYRVNTTDVNRAVAKILDWMVDAERTLHAESDGTIPIGVAMLPAFDAGATFIKRVTDQIAAATRDDTLCFDDECCLFPANKDPNVTCKANSGGTAIERTTFGPFTEAEVAQLAKIKAQYGASSNAGPSMVVALGSFGVYQSREKTNGKVETVTKPYGVGTILALAVPSPASNVTGVVEYRQHLQAYAEELPEEQRPFVTPNFFSLEAYLVAALLATALDRHGRDLTGESFIDTLELLEGVRLGVGLIYGFSDLSHQAQRQLWGHQLDATLQPVELGLLVDQ